jgi:hypothetical protein
LLFSFYNITESDYLPVEGEIALFKILFSKRWFRLWTMPVAVTEDYLADEDRCWDIADTAGYHRSTTTGPKMGLRIYGDMCNRSLVVMLSLSILEVVSSNPARAGVV